MYGGLLPLFWVATNNGDAQPTEYKQQFAQVDEEAPERSI